MSGEINYNTHLEDEVRGSQSYPIMVILYTGGNCYNLECIKQQCKVSRLKSRYSVELEALPAIICGGRDGRDGSEGGTYFRAAGSCVSALHEVLCTTR